MSATTTKRPAKFATPEQYKAADKALSNAYDHIERLSWDLQSIVNNWDEVGEMLDHPTFETIGMLADFVDTLTMDVQQLTGKRDELAGYLHEVCLIRGDLPTGGRDAR